MRPGDLEAVRLEIVDQQLAEAAFLAQLLLGGEAGASVLRLTKDSSYRGVVR
jgi:hypothetical protein